MVLDQIFALYKLLFLLLVIVLLLLLLLVVVVVVVDLVVELCSTVTMGWD